ncbi:MAG: hypothetical protein ACI9M3_000830 [Bacteroidia bacterium]|jgi:hypothetical protein
MGSFRDSTGRKHIKHSIDRMSNNAKRERMQMQIDEHGYNFCEDCERNDCKPVDMSHDISVDQCQKDPNTPLELAWSVSNITPRGRRCHIKHDSLSRI